MKKVLHVLIDAALHRKLKALAATRDLTMPELIEALAKEAK